MSSAPSSPGERPAKSTPDQNNNANHLPRMVGWYDPKLLARSGVEVAVSTIFGRHSDHRLIEALATGAMEYYDYTSAGEGEIVREGAEKKPLPEGAPPRESIWIDYAGDVGDGWNPTYAVAYHIATAHYLTGTEKLKYKDEHGAEHEVEKGDLLVFGGDEVYPTASREEYEKRLVAPYETALKETKAAPYPHVFAVPGNHDWYDSLVAFMRLFASQRWFGGWRTRQNRSYFALKLPHGWWLLGTDVQLGSDLDAQQVKYFEWVAGKMGEDDKVILCHAEPHWVFAETYQDLDSAYDESNLAFLEKKLGKRVAVFIAGDLHHYRRHALADETCQKITAGGGGAFLHPTHSGLFGAKFETIRERRTAEMPGDSVAAQEEGAAPARIFHLRGRFPTEEDSRKVCRRNLWFPWNEGNGSRNFGGLTAALYWLITLAFTLSFVANSQFPLASLGTYLGAALNTFAASVLTQIWALFWLGILILGFCLFTDTHSNRYRIIAGSLHAAAHFLAAFVIATGALFAVVAAAGLVGLAGTALGPVSLGGYEITFDLKPLLSWLLILAVGFLIGPLIMGLYLYISMNIFGRHANEAFSSIAIQDWKHFLKLHIDPAGQLTIYPIGIKRVPRKWKERAAGTAGPALVPDDPRATEPVLIEPPVKLATSSVTATGVAPTSPGAGAETSTGRNN